MPSKITASNLVSAINRLSRDQAFDYISLRTSTKIQITGITLPEGPIRFKRWNPHQQNGAVKEFTISTHMLWRVANAIRPGCPINIDRILGASYNTRSALECMLAHTPEFFFCYPGRIEDTNSTSEVKHGHKHLLWNPDAPHSIGRVAQIETDLIISEVPTTEAIYEALVVPDVTEGDPRAGMTLDQIRRHAQMQIALVIIGRTLGSETWVAQNVIASLKTMKQIKSFEPAIRAAQMIDCIWFRNSRFMPAVFEVEHSTGVTSGLSRMKNFKDNIPPFGSRWVIVAPDDLREKVMRETNKPQFLDMDAQFFSYSAVEELFSLCQRRQIRGVNDEFLDCFMEPCVLPPPVHTN